MPRIARNNLKLSDMDDDIAEFVKPRKKGTKMKRAVAASAPAAPAAPVAAPSSELLKTAGSATESTKEVVKAGGAASPAPAPVVETTVKKDAASASEEGQTPLFTAETAKKDQVSEEKKPGAAPDSATNEDPQSPASFARELVAKVQNSKLAPAAGSTPAPEVAKTATEKPKTGTRVTTPKVTKEPAPAPQTGSPLDNLDLDPKFVETVTSPKLRQATAEFAREYAHADPLTQTIIKRTAEEAVGGKKKRPAVEIEAEDKIIEEMRKNFTLPYAEKQRITAANFAKVRAIEDSVDPEKRQLFWLIIEGVYMSTIAGVVTSMGLIRTDEEYILSHMELMNRMRVKRAIEDGEFKTVDDAYHHVQNYGEGAAEKSLRSIVSYVRGDIDKVEPVNVQTTLANGIQAVVHAMTTAKGGNLERIFKDKDVPTETRPQLVDGSGVHISNNAWTVICSMIRSNAIARNRVTELLNGIYGIPLKVVVTLLKPMDELDYTFARKFAATLIGSKYNPMETLRALTADIKESILATQEFEASIGSLIQPERGLTYSVMKITADEMKALDYSVIINERQGLAPLVTKKTNKGFLETRFVG